MVAYWRWRRGGAGWTRCREEALYNGICVRATRSCAAASAWRSSDTVVGRTRQQRGMGRLSARAQSADRSAQRLRQVLNEGLSQRGRLDVLGVTRRSAEGRWRDTERRRPRGGGACDRGSVGRMHACA
jgi:hypothetical protein